MRIDHIFYTVGYKVTAGQGVEHPVVPHGDAVVDGDGIEFGCVATKGLDLAFHQLTNVVKMSVARNKLGE